MVEELRTMQQLVALEDAWNALLDRSGSRTVYLSFEWVTAWLAWVGRHVEPLVLVARDTDGKVIGIAPLMITESVSLEGARSREIEFIGSPNSDYSDFIIDRDRDAVVRALLAHLLRGPRSWDRARLGEIPERSPNVGALQRMCQRPWFPGVLVPGEACPTLILEGDTAKIREELARKKYIGKRDARRSMQHLGTLGAVSVRHCATVEEAQGALRDLVRLHRRRWGATSKFERPGYEAFYRDLLVRLWPRGEVAVSVLELDSSPIAVSYAFRHREAWTNHMWVHDPSYSKVSPGTLLIHFMACDALERGYGEFDFTRGAEAYKQRFSNRTKRNLDLIVYASHRDYIRVEGARLLAWSKGEVAGRHPRLHHALGVGKRRLLPR